MGAQMVWTILQPSDSGTDIRTVAKHPQDQPRLSSYRKVGALAVDSGQHCGGEQMETNELHLPLQFGGGFGLQVKKAIRDDSKTATLQSGWFFFTIVY